MTRLTKEEHGQIKRTEKAFNTKLSKEQICIILGRDPFIKKSVAPKKIKAIQTVDVEPMYLGKLFKEKKIIKNDTPLYLKKLFAQRDEHVKEERIRKQQVASPEIIKKFFVQIERLRQATNKRAETEANRPKVRQKRETQTKNKQDINLRLDRLFKQIRTVVNEEEREVRRGERRARREQNEQLSPVRLPRLFGEDDPDWVVSLVAEWVSPVYPTETWRRYKINISDGQATPEIINGSIQDMIRMAITRGSAGGNSVELPHN